MIDELFDRLAKLESAPRDPEAAAAIAEGLRAAPNAVYPLVQTVLVQDEALKRANAHIQDLEQALSAGSGQGSGQAQSGGFLDTMRDKLFGQQQNQQRGSVPNVPPPPPENRPVWNSGQVMGQMPPGRYDQAPNGQGYGQGYGQGPYGAPQSPLGGGGSFLGTAAATAAGFVGGSLLLNSIRGMMGGGHHQAFGDTTLASERGSNPSSDQSNTPLAHDLGVDDIGRSADRGDNSRAGLFDQASNDDHNDRDEMDMDADDFGGNDDSDYA
jgi:hypothetical protein